MRVKGGARRRRVRRVGWTGDRRGNMQVVEVMIVGLLVVAAVVAVSTMNVPVTETEGFKQDNERLVKDSLQAMLSRPSDRELFGSVLEEHVMEAVSGNPKALMDHLNKTLPSGAQYNVYLDNHHGAPIPIVEQGKAPREAVAGAIQFVPKLAYTFMIPEFALYHGDFDMNVYAVPIQNGVLLRDEGEAVELAVTVQPLDDEGAFAGEAVVIKTYSHTALRMNDPAKRSWPSISMWYEDPADPGQPRYRIDASDTLPYWDRLSNLSPRRGDAFNITFDMKVQETANIKVPKNAEITFEFPRGFDFNESKRDWVANSTGPGGTNNNVWWKDWVFRGAFDTGWTVSAKTKETFRASSVPLVMSSNYLTILDTAYPFYAPITVTMGNGVQGHTNLVLDTPSIPVTGAYGREAYLSVAKPLISGAVSPWGMAFANDGAGTDSTTADRVRIENITLRNPQGQAIFTDVEHTGGWVEGEWKEYGPGHWYWKTSQNTDLNEATQVDLAFNVTGGHTNDNSYRNQDYLEVLSRFNPENTTAAVNTLHEWEFEKRSWRMGGEWVYRESVPPYDDIPGWPDQPDATYWITGGAFAYKKSLPGNTTYRVLPSGAAANAFGGYQGAHVASSLEIVDEKGYQVRDFDLGDKAHIKNDFRALFGALSSLQSGTFTVSDLQVQTSVYTVEKAWKGIPEAVFTQQAEVAANFGSVAALLSDDLNKDGTEDLVVVGTGGIVYALDGRDGAKFWLLDTGTTVSSAALVDADDDDVYELVLGFNGALLKAYTTSTKSSIVDRLLWERSVMPLIPWGAGTWKVTHILDTRGFSGGNPDIVVGVSAETGQSHVNAIDISPTAAAPWGTSVTATYNASALLPNDPGRLTDIVKVSRADHGDPTPHLAVASLNKTVTMLSLPALKEQWIKQVPSVVDQLIAVDLDDDGHDDLVADTSDTSGLSVGGQYVFTLSGRSGEFGPVARTVATPTSEDVWDATFTELGAFATRATETILSDPDGLYENEFEAISEVFLDAGTGLFASPNGTVYLLDMDGEVFQTQQADPFGNGFEWFQTIPKRGTTAIAATDLHVEDTWPQGGRLYQLSASGHLLSYTTDMGTGATWTDLASLCTHASLPHAGLSCADTFPVDWEVETDATGVVEAFWMLSATMGVPFDKVSLHRFDVQSNAWTEEAVWLDDGTRAGYNQMHRDTNGTIWLTGYDPVSGNGTILEMPETGPDREHTVWRAEGKVLSAVHVKDDGTGWATTTSGDVYHRAGDDTWVPFYVAGVTAGDRALLVEDPDGTVWWMGKGFTHVPLTAYDQKATAEFGAFYYGPATTDNIMTVTVTAREGHLGGTDIPVTKEALTKVRWYAKAPGGDPVMLSASTTPDVPMVYTRTHTGQVTCATDCSGVEIEIWAELENDWRRDEGSVVTGGALTPAIKDFDVELNTASAGSHLHLDVDPRTLAPGSTAVYSPFYKGAVLGESRLPWTFFGGSDTGHKDKERHVAVSPTGVVDGSTGPDVFIVQRAGIMERWVIDGRTGIPQRPSDLSSFGFTPADRVNAVLVMDAAGDGKNDLVMFGSFGPTGLPTRIWDVAAGSDHDGGNPTPETIREVTAAGMANGRAVFGYAEDNRINVLQESLVTGTPTLKWTSAPAEDQGKATFEYDIPKNAMYGTAIVVSELRFDVTDNGIPVTQTARIVDWFNIKPPGREVPRPPIYTVQIVSWFNEA